MKCAYVNILDMIRTILLTFARFDVEDGSKIHFTTGCLLHLDGLVGTLP